MSDFLSSARLRRMDGVQIDQADSGASVNIIDEKEIGVDDPSHPK